MIGSRLVGKVVLFHDVQVFVSGANRCRMAFSLILGACSWRLFQREVVPYDADMIVRMYILF